MICHCAECIPKNVDQVVLLWQGGGSKLQYTKVHPVSKSTGTAVFESNTQLRQVCTLCALYLARAGPGHHSLPWSFRQALTATGSGPLPTLRTIVTCAALNHQPFSSIAQFMRGRKQRSAITAHLRVDALWTAL